MNEDVVMIADHRISGWLGVALQELDENQRAEFSRLLVAYEATQEGRTGEPADHADQDDAARRAIFEQVTGELDVAARGRAYRKARADAYAGAVIATLAGMSEVQAAREATLPRLTLRKALGKG